MSMVTLFGEAGWAAVLGQTTAPADRDRILPHPSAPLPRRQRRWPDLIWAFVVGTADIFLRRWHGVREFTRDPSCLLRISHLEAPRDITLCDGTCIRAGEPILMLHIWNEHLPRFFRRGADFRWAMLVRRHMAASLRELADLLDHDPAMGDVRAVYACVALGRRRRRWQLRHAATRFGFELMEASGPSGLRGLGEDMLLWAFARAFNPAALRRHCFRRTRAELWISRATLLHRYGQTSRRRPVQPPTHAAAAE